MAWVEIVRIGQISGKIPVSEPIEDKHVFLPGQVGGMLNLLAEIRWTTKGSPLGVMIERVRDGSFRMFLGSFSSELTFEWLKTLLSNLFPGTLIRETRRFSNIGGSKGRQGHGLQVDIRGFQVNDDDGVVPADHFATALRPGQQMTLWVEMISLGPDALDKERQPRLDFLIGLKPEESERGIFATFKRGGTWVAPDKRMKQEVLLRELEALGVAGAAPGWRCWVEWPGDLTRSPVAGVARAWGGSADLVFDCQKKNIEPLNDGIFARGWASLAEAATLLALPTRSVAGLPVVALPDLAGAPRHDENNMERVRLGIGSVYGENVEITLPVFREHMIVAGTTGSGKSTTVISIVRQLLAAEVPVTVLSPAKGEDYEEIFGNHVYRLSGAIGREIRFNPLRAPSEIPISRHIDGLKSAFEASFSMEGPLPQLFERVLHRAFEGAGWDLSTGIRKTSASTPDEAMYYPTLSDMLRLVPAVAREAGYGPEITQNVQGALTVRLRSLCTGFKGRMLNTRTERGIEEVLGESSLVRLDDLGNDEERAFVISMLFLRLEYLRKLSGAVDGDQKPRHVLVIEEAHRVLRQVTAASRDGGSSVQSRAIESFANLLAELRAYGEGVIVVDQSPSELIPAVLKNSNTKIFHRLVESGEAETAAGSLGLRDDDASALVGLQAGEAFFLTKGMPRPCLLKVTRSGVVNV